MTATVTHDLHRRAPAPDPVPLRQLVAGTWGEGCDRELVDVNVIHRPDCLKASGGIRR